jgi:hypothetical protein
LLIGSGFNALRLSRFSDHDRGHRELRIGNENLLRTGLVTPISLASDGRTRHWDRRPAVETQSRAVGRQAGAAINAAASHGDWVSSIITEVRATRDFPAANEHEPDDISANLCHTDAERAALPGVDVELGDIRWAEPGPH